MAASGTVFGPLEHTFRTAPQLSIEYTGEPICKGKGDFDDGDYVDVGFGGGGIQVSADTPCNYCDEQGMIEIGGEVQKRNRIFKLGMEYLEKHAEEGKSYSSEEIMAIGQGVYSR